MDYDAILQEIGEFGRYQKRVYFLICLVGFPLAFQNMGIVFLAGSPDHWCHDPELQRFNLSQEQLKKLTIPKEVKDGEERYSQCKVYDINFRRFTQNDVRIRLKEMNAVNYTSTEKTKKCNSWKYDPTSFYQSTIVTEWDLVCTRRWLGATAASVYMAGLMCGVFLSGGLSDRFGRRKALLVALAAVALFSITVSFSPNYVAFVIIRFCIGFCGIAAFTTAFVLGLEIVGPSWRVFAGVAIQYFWAFGFILLAGIAYLVPAWRSLQLTISVPMVLFGLYYWFIPESPRWLLANDREKEANELIQKMTEVNRVKPSKKEDKRKPQVDKATQADEAEAIVVALRKATVLDLVRTPNMRKKSLNICFNWFVNSLVYYGLSLNTSNLGGNDYLNFLASGAVEIPAYIFCQIALVRIGNRRPLSGCMLLGGVALFLTMLIPKELNWLSITLAMIGKFGISASFAIIYIFSAELFPTVVRNVGMGSASFCARLGGILAPYIAQLSDFSKHLPIVIFGALSILAGLLALLLPETLGQTLPQTIAQGEEFGRVQKTQDKATCTSDEEIYRIAYTYDNSASEGYSTDGGEWINYADAYESGVENVGFSNTTTV